MNKVKFLVITIALMMTIGNASADCSLNPDAKDKCDPELMRFYEPILNRWQQDSKNENSVLNSSYWPEKPDCPSGETSSVECPSIADIKVTLTELPQVQVSYFTYAATISACSGYSGASCHLYHRVYLLVDYGYGDMRKIAFCSQVSCP